MKCCRCGRTAEGWAFINEARFCHDGPSPTCYEAEQRRVHPSTEAFLAYLDSLG